MRRAWVPFLILLFLIGMTIGVVTKVIPMAAGGLVLGLVGIAGGVLSLRHGRDGGDR